MKKVFLLLICMFIVMSAFSQNYDLIVKSDGDSIPCQIDSITNSRLYFTLKHRGHWTQTFINSNQITEYKYNVLPKKSVKYLVNPKYGNSHASDLERKKNVIHGTVGFLGVWAVANINYERLILDRKDKFLNTLWLRVGGGGYAGWDVSGPHAVVGFTLITGKKNSHIETHLGLGSTYDKTGYNIGLRNARGGSEPEPSRSDFIDFAPSCALGYRFQKPKGGVVFRTGFGFPETLYIGVGINF